MKYALFYSATLSTCPSCGAMSYNEESYDNGALPTCDGYYRVSHGYAS